MLKEIRDVSHIKFGILSAEDIRAQSVVQITSSKISGSGTVYDPLMGHVIDFADDCPTCGLKRDCWGHFGHIEFNEPMIHPMFYKEVEKFLKCFCKKCYRLLMTEAEIKLRKIKNRYQKLSNLLPEIVLCPHCDSPQPKISYKTKEQIFTMEHEKKKREAKNIVIMEVSDIKTIFDNIPEADLVTFGLDVTRLKPKNLILVNLPVIPPCSRPYVVTDGNTCDDDLTIQYIEIVKFNNQLAEEKLDETKRKQKFAQMKFRVSTTMNNNKGKAKNNTDSRALKGFKERLSGKDGRLRGNLMGKRVDFSGRTVIGPEPTLKVGELAVPEEICRIETFPERVTDFNKEWLRSLIQAGKANYIIVPTEKNGQMVMVRKNLSYSLYRKGTELIYGDYVVRNTQTGFVREEDIKIGDNKPHSENKSVYVYKITDAPFELRKGDKVVRNGKFLPVIYPEKRSVPPLNNGEIVERHIQNGDITILNRQPTLHRGSMIGHKVVKMDGKTLRFNLPCTKSLNADFDGDESNIHVPQSYSTRVELEYISDARKHLITAQDSRPVMGIFQDGLVACYLMTKEKFELSQAQFNDICMKMTNFRYERIAEIQEIYDKYDSPDSVYSGKGLISMILPRDFLYERKNTQSSIVRIHRGVVLEGIFDKSIVGAVSGSIVHILNKEYGYEVASSFLDELTFICNEWLLIHGFSIGIKDCMIESDNTHDTIQSTITQCYTTAEGIKRSTQNPGIREIRITSALSGARDIGMNIAKKAISHTNNFLTTVKSGAKGDFFNIAQLTGLLGQQNLEGKRVTPTLNQNTRTLPHYPMNKELPIDQEYESRGFVRHSFIHGLAPQEFFFHAMSGREGVADTAMSTAKSGYTQRKMVKLGEDVIISEDGTVRDQCNKIYQYSYGENDYNPIHTVKVGGIPQICDVSRLVNRLNMCHEEKIPYTELDLEQPELEIEIKEASRERDIGFVIDEEPEEEPEEGEGDLAEKPEEGEDGEESASEESEDLEFEEDEEYGDD